VLEGYLLQFMDIHECKHFLSCRILLPDSKCIKSFLSQQIFPVINWPGNSPDLNLIEYSLNHMKNS
jgi:hypothetical protein